MSKAKLFDPLCVVPAYIWLSDPPFLRSKTLGYSGGCPLQVVVYKGSNTLLLSLELHSFVKRVQVVLKAVRDL